MTDKDLGTAAGDIFAKAFNLGYETGREYVPVGGMALTAEQVEDVEALVATANPYSAPAVRLRALFPATEPAEEVKPCGSNSITLGWCKLAARHEGLHTNGTYLWGTPSEPDPPAPAEPAEGVKPVKFRKMTPKYATANFGFPDVTVDPFTPFTRWAYKDSDGDKWAWNGDQWELHVVPPTPAEPAEEETKAEDYCCHPMCRHTNWGGSNRKHTRGSDCPIVPKPASSPVVPAHTETGPWHAVAEIPKGVACIRDREGDVWRRCGSGWEHGALHDPVDYSPFVAVKEEEA